MGFCCISTASLQIISHPPAYLPLCVLCTAYMVPETAGDFQTEGVSCHLSLREGNVNKEGSHGRNEVNRQSDVESPTVLT